MNRLNYQRLCLLFGMAFIFLVGCGAKAIPVNDTEVAVESVEKDQSVKDQVEALTPEDPRRQRVMTLTWQIQYQREKLMGLELKYLGACYKDKEYRDAMTAIENLNKQIRQLMLL